MTQENLTFKMTVPDQHPCFADHFPGDPLVPGALLLQWVADELSQRYPMIQIGGVSRFKFLAPVRPETQLLVECQWGERDLTIKLSTQQDVVGQGKLMVRPA